MNLQDQVSFFRALWQNTMWLLTYCSSSQIYQNTNFSSWSISIVRFITGHFVFSGADCRFVILMGMNHQFERGICHQSMSSILPFDDTLPLQLNKNQMSNFKMAWRYEIKRPIHKNEHCYIKYLYFCWQPCFEDINVIFGSINIQVSETWMTTRVKRNELWL